MARIAVGGWQHETNTFAPIKADFTAFEEPSDWPGLSRGAALFDAVHGVHLPITGALQVLREAGHEILPLLWCSATPCAQVTEDAYEHIAAMLLDDLGACGKIDGLYLDLHGAMVAEHLEDGEGELLRRIRHRFGADLPISVSLDLHANLTEEMVEHASVIDIYRTYPHIDMGETGARAAQHLLALVSSGARWHSTLRRTDFLIPVNWGCTLIDPAKSVYEAVSREVTGPVTAAAFACGFPLSDIAEVGPAALAYGTSEAAARGAAERLLQAAQDREGDFDGRIYLPDEAVAEAQRLAKTANGPVIIADTQDNPGGGGPGDTTGMLNALIAAGAEDAVFGLLCDAEAATAAHRAGPGAILPLALGAKSGMPGHLPLEADCTVLRLGSGQFTATGPMYAGAHMDLGPMALLRVFGVRVVVSSRAAQLADRSMLRHLGIEPSAERIIVLKSSVHFRNDFQEIAGAVLIAAAPGPVFADPGRLDFKRVRPGLRLMPHADYKTAPA